MPRKTASPATPAAVVPPRFRPTHVLVHYSEIGLKGRNRGFFEDALMRNLRLALRGLGYTKVRRLYGRILVEFSGEVPAAEVAERLHGVYGIAHCEPAARVELDIDRIEAAVGELIDGLSVASFAVVTQRGNKGFPLNSIEVNRRLGRFVVERSGWKVSLDDPELAIRLFLVEKDAFVAFERIEGPGGLPVGVTGKVACLLSGGIDSPVAAARMMRRGAEPVFVHFHSAPHTSAASREKVVEIAGHLVRRYRPVKLWLVPFAELQRRIVTETPAPLRVVLYRRFMLRAAEAIALREGARALVTGENLGQVASQTLENLATIERAVTLPVLRPVIGWDKREIIAEAEAIGTFETSIEPHDDCCSYLMPQRPATRTTPEELDAAEAGFEVAAEVAALLEQAEAIEVGPRSEASADGGNDRSH